MHLLNNKFITNDYYNNNNSNKFNMFIQIIYYDKNK